MILLMPYRAGYHLSYHLSYQPRRSDNLRDDENLGDTASKVTATLICASGGQDKPRRISDELICANYLPDKVNDEVK